MLNHALLRRTSVITVSALLGGLLVGTVGAAPAAAAGERLTLAKTADTSVLPGEPISYTLRASNPGTAPEYNLAFRDELPVGVSYQPGSTTPAGAGEPTIVTAGTGPAEHQVLLWENVADLQVGGDYQLGFTVTTDPAVLPAGASAVNAGSAYANTDPRIAPGFDGSGTADPTSYTESASSGPVTTTISAIEIRKREPSSEGELMRGLHTQGTIYMLRVRNSGQGATHGAQVVDYLPANLEFLGCGALDNTGGGRVEYPGAPRLTSIGPLPSCVMPDRVETVVNPVATPPLPAGVYTKLTWNLGTLAAGATVERPYRAGIPLRANTAEFAGGTPIGFTAQAANLDNNTGPSTRETATEQSATNRAIVTGDYAGTYQGSPTPGNTPVSADDELTRSVEDLALAKSVNPTKFDEGKIATYTLRIRGSQYTSAAGVVLTDVLPDGLCPLDDTGNHAPGTPAECASGAKPTISGSPTGTIAFDAVTHAGQEYTIRFTAFEVPANGVVTVTYQARMRATYDAGNPTAAGDSYTNHVSLTGVTTPVTGTGETGDRTVSDVSEATITSSGPSIDKTILPATNAPYVCNTSGYAQSTSLTHVQRTFQQGDRICFTLRVDFPGTTTTRNAVVTDFLPRGTRYEPGSMTLTGANTVPAADVSFDEAAAVGGANPTWQLGAPNHGARYVAKGAVFEARIAVIVTSPAPARAREVRGNLMKLRAESTGGVVYSLRDREDAGIAPTPDVGIVKGVANVNAGPANGPNVDDVTVREGDVVTFRVDVTNKGVDTNSTDVPVHHLQVWDVLPAGITCAAIGAISDGGSCSAPGARPVADATRSTIGWPVLPAALAPGATRTLTYTMTVPAGTGVSANLVNTASVRTFQADANTGAAVDFYPKNNVDTTVPAAQQRAPVATDPSNVRLPDTSVTKTQTTSITENNNNTPTQATIGEVVTYTVTSRVPARTTVYRGVLSDPVPTGLTLLNVTGTQSLDGGTTTVPLALPDFSATGSANSATLRYPQTYQNTSNTDHVFGLAITARVNTVTSNAHGTNRTNTATFTSTTTAGGGTNLPGRTASSTTQVVVPAPTLGKTSNVTSATAGQTVTFTLTANNGSGRPPAHDTVVVDCVPAGLNFSGYGALSQGTTSPAVPGDGTNGCATGTTKLTWNIGTVSATTPQTLTYTAVVNPAAAGAAAYTNTATLTGSTLRDGGNDCSATTIERCVTATASRTINVAPVGLTKSTSTPTRTIGERARFTVTATIPANINYYNASLIDQLPAGLDAATLVTESATCTPGCTATATPLTTVANPGSTTIGWLFGDLLAQPGVRTLTVTYTALVRDVPSNARGTALTNSATARWNLNSGLPPTSAGASFDRSSTTGTATVTVQEPRVRLTKGVSDTTPEPGQTFTYTVTATNGGAGNLSTAHGVVVVDTVPTGVVVTPASISDGGVLTGAGANGGGTITWTLTTLAPNASKALSYQGKLAASTTLTAAGLTNSVDATYDSLPAGGRHYDDVPAATATVTPDFPHVAAAKTAVTAGPAYVGEDFVWRVTITNDGRGTAYGIDALDTLPPNWTYRAGTAQISIAGGAATQVEPVLGGSPATGSTLSWTDLGDLAPGQALTITLTTRPTAAALETPGAGASIAHTNTVRPHGEDATGADRNATGPYSGPDATATARIHAADLMLAKSVAGAFVAGQQGAWTLRVTNNGPDPAVGPFTLTDTVPNGVTFVSATGAGWSCSYDGPSRVATCTRTVAGETLASGASFLPVTLTVAIAADTADGTSYTNSGQVSGRTHDPDPDNNTDDATATVTTRADLRIVKALSGPMVAGTDATYTLDVTNLGPSDASAKVRVVDTLPTGTTYRSSAGTGWDCSVSGAPGAQTLTCERGLLAAGAAAPQLTVVVAVPSDRTGAVVNTATVSSPTTDPNPGNNTSTVTTTPGTAADLALTKTHVGTLTAGENGTYRFRVDNLGPSDAAGPLTLTDTLPAGVTYVAVAVADGWSCAASGQDLTCTRGAGLAAGAHSTFEVTVAVAADVTGNLHNSATVGSPTTDPDPSNNTDTDDSTTTTSADLALRKTASADPVTAGTALSYTLAVRNLGPSTARDVSVSDTLPAGLTYVGATGTGWTCGYTAATRLVDCTRAALTAGASAPDITIATTVDPDAGPTAIRNAADVTASTPDPVPGNNHDEVTVTVVDRADVSLRKSRVGSGPVTAGTSTSFTLRVHNAGPSDADALVVTDTLPSGLLAQSATGTGWNCDVTPSAVTCARPSLAAGQDAPDITVTARVAAWVADGQTLVNTATVTTTTPGDDPDDNTDTANVPVDTSADLSLAKSHRGNTAAAGGTVTYDLLVHNAGPSDAAPTVRVTDTLPAGTSFVSAAAPWSCAVDPGDPQQVDCTLGTPATAVAAGADAPPLTMIVAIASDADPGAYRNTAEVGSPTPDPDPSNNTDDDTVTVATVADLAIVKSHTGPVRIGEPLEFTLQVTNLGPSQARDVTVDDVLPAGLTYVSAAGAGWSCDATGAAVSCERPTLDAGQSSAITVTAIVDAEAYPSVSNTAVVGSTTPDSDPDNNTSSDEVAVPPLVDLGITKSHKGDAAVGGTVDFLLTVVNNGPTADPGPVTVTDQLPKGLTPSSAAGPGWACEIAGQSVTCVRGGGLAASATSTITVRAAVQAGAYPEVVNTATVATPAEDTDPTNDTATDRVPVTPQVSLALTKDLLGYDRASRVATWRLTVVNLGPNATVDPVIVVDRLPAQLSYQGARGSGWTCAAVGQVVTCTHADSVRPGDAASVEIDTAVDAAPGSTVVNEAEITSGSQGDTNPRDDRDTASLDVPEGGGPPLPHSGAEVLTLLLLGFALLLVGGSLLRVARTRR